ncbi:MAG: hypothetical protein HZB13_05255 [Acidobacteria bacterium]|nr:hypothetical protein [Acidobacteriota bacterium]
MHSANAAEWVLRLVTSPERAASTVGDLLEESTGRNILWFWTSTLRTAACHVLKDLWVFRGRMAWLAFSGLVEFVLLGMALGMVVIRLWTDYFPYQYGPNSTYIPPWGFYCIIAAMVTAVPLMVGWEIASRSRGRELAAALALALALAVPNALRAIGSGKLVHRIETPYPYVDNILVGFFTMALFATAGAMLFRLRDLPRGRSVLGSVRPK